jgi:GTP-binding protein
MSPFNEVRFVASAHELRELPLDVGVEAAFAGRSNAGKSSAINALTQRRRLAFVSKTPGRTQTINFFECGANRRLVDLPGYGYAAVSQTERAHWGRLIGAYLTERASLRGLVLIADARRSLTPLDEQLVGWYATSGGPLLVLLTKADKLTQREAAASLKKAHAQLSRIYPAARAQLFSAVDGTGVHPAQRMVHAWLDGNKKPPVKGE